MEIIGRGAEAVLKKQGDSLVKERIKKRYRIDEIDNALRKDRTVKEARILIEARRLGVKAPIVRSKDLEKMTIEMEFLRGPVLRDQLEKLSAGQQKKVCSAIGRFVAKLHKGNIIHSDLTTSNMILKDGKLDELYLIDFGLSFSSKKIEDKAVDLHLIKRALISKHNKIWKSCFKHILDAYKKELGAESAKIIARVSAIEKRGRYAER
ncbi:MAG: KEOPS complex kinase/ATPase Bud32 [Candidatus Nanoarchaeia archaeon]|nr:KEOPS complex kinase/ATPase Bud32 [Candidatus Nanoarchaeia archaeon]MDD5239459.1 KEOPS complex kinase/ATPase Bud32 [Candidatus Nanoarchaeia archaeon]